MSKATPGSYLYSTYFTIKYTLLSVLHYLMPRTRRRACLAGVLPGGQLQVGLWRVCLCHWLAGSGS